MDKRTKVYNALTNILTIFVIILALIILFAHIASGE